MEEQTTQKPTKGTWEKLGQKSEGIEFELNKPVLVEFLTDAPEEKESQFDDETVYYVFPVRLVVDGTETVIQTSAWTLLGGIKVLGPLKGKKAQISKTLDKGRQKFNVIPMV